MTSTRFLLNNLLILTILLGVASTSEAQLEPRFFPVGSTTVAAYYVPHLDITVAADMNTINNIVGWKDGYNFEQALHFLDVLNMGLINGTSYLGVSTWGLPTASRNDPGCTNVYTQQTGLPADGNGFYCTASEMGYLWYTEGHGLKQARPTNWPFTGNAGQEYWSGTRGANANADPRPWFTRIAFDTETGNQLVWHEFKRGYVWPVTDGDPLAQPAVKIIGPVVNFGSQDLNTTSAVHAATVYNSGLAPLTIQSVSNSNPAEFPESTDLCSGTTLAPRERCSVLFNFAPTRDGGRSAKIEILSNAQSSPDTVSLIGTGIGTAVEVVSPTQIILSHTLHVGSVSNIYQITLSNRGTADFKVLSVTSDNPQWVIGVDTCTPHPIIYPYPFGLRNSCVVTVQAHPSSPGSINGHITFTTDSPSSPISVAVALDATEAALGITHSSLDFGGQIINTKSSTRTVTITNTGDDNLGLGIFVHGRPIPFARSDSDEFEVRNNHCVFGDHLISGASCTFDVVFFPKAAGPRSGQIHLTSTTRSSIRTVSLHGIGEAVAREVLIPDDLHYGEQPVGTSSAAKTVSLINFGSEDINVTSVIPDNVDFEIGTDTCTGQLVAPNTGCGFDVLFKPTGAGAQSGHIVVSSDAPSTPDSVAVAGTGTVPELTVSPPQVSFPRQVVGDTAAAKTFTLSNTGKADLAVSAVTTSMTEFPITSDTCTAQTLQPGASCSFLVAFVPSRDGGISGSIEIVSNAPTSPDAALVSGTGLGVPSDSLSPSQLHFDVHAVGTTSSVQLVTMTNIGTAALPVTTITSDASEFALVNDACSGQSIPIGGTCLFGVQFSPTQAGAQSGHLEVLSAAGTSPDHIAVTGTGGEAAVTLSPNHLSFGHLDLGTVSGPLVVTVTNSGNTSLALASVSSQNSAEFPLASDTCSGESIPPGHSCVFSVTFAPSRDGGSSGLITLDSNSPQSPHSMSVGGNGVGIGLDTLAPNELHFANLTVGSISGVRTVTMTNTGTADIDVATVLSDNPGFVVTNDMCSGQAIPPFGVCDFGVQFAPTLTGAQQGHIEVSSNAITAPDHVAVTGFGVESRLAATPSHLDFGSWPVGSSETRTVLLSNPGTTDISVSGVTLATGLGFTIGTDNCSGMTLTPGADCSFAVGFSPGRDGGASGVAEFASDAATSPGGITLTGSGVGTASELLTPTELHFDSQPVATASAQKVVTLTNTGTADLNIGTLSSDNPEFSIVGDTCSGQAVVMAGTCEFGVIFTPVQAGSQSGGIEIPSDSATSPDHVSLTGIGVTSAVSLSPSHLTFGSWPIGDSSGPRAVIVTNTGMAALAVSGINLSNSSEFALGADGCSGQSLAPGDDCTFSVVFTPSAEGGQSTLIQVSSDAPSSPDALSGAGNGVGVAAESILPASLVFSGTPILETSREQYVFMTNLGTADLVVGNILTLPNFGIVDDNCSGQTVIPQANCTFGVVFTPLQEGFLDAVIVVPSNATTPEMIPVSGHGLKAAETIFPAVAIPILGPLGLLLLAMVMGIAGVGFARYKRAS
jgi:hypothetical protein